MPARGAAPSIWLLLGDKLGDNAQVEVIARALGLPVIRKTVLPKPEWVLGKPPFRPSLDHLDLERSDPLEPPWPDLVLTIGRRPAAAALWIREQSGGAARLAIVGRPKRWSDRFALIIAPPQFAVPEAPNVLRLELPLMRPDAAAVAAAGERWRDRLAAMPRPLTAVLVGGETKPYRFDAPVAGRLLEALAALRQRDGGSLYLTTSRRTQPAVVEALEHGLPEGSRLFRWAPDAADNPYLALLALADRFVVTGDSISMMVEVARLGRPLSVFPLPVRRDPATRVQRGLASALAPQGPLAGLGGALRRRGLLGFPRDLDRVRRSLERRGLAVPLGEPFAASAGEAGDELAEVVARVRGLLAP
ncbi:ELM1/GtrOC1 family putative glycosyltransferase [Geminicoccaceae bacterium 1502E]|nr:ELM1/GtrOC1 family putative glycosyltransferase [Geminicoccaceae bacterium 1502E]